MITETRKRTNDPYLAWLMQKTAVGEGGKPYVRLEQVLHSIIFKPDRAVPMDVNRAYDGLSLRVRFMNKYGNVGSSTNRGPCTFLEMLVALAEKMSFLMTSENEPGKTALYFWHMLRNMRLLRMTDDSFDRLNGEFFTEEAAQRIVDRNYDENGDGGLFPIMNPTENQRNVELWYQMQAWLNEHSAIDLE